MNVIITDNKNIKYSNFTIFSKMSELYNMWDRVGSIIIHSTQEKEYEVGIALAEANKNGVQKFIYINKKPVEIIALCIKALKGVTYDDEDLLKNEDLLVSLIEMYKDLATDNETNETEESIGIINDFIDGFVNNNPKVNLPAIRDRVITAVNELNESSKSYELQREEISKATLEIFKKTSEQVKAHRVARDKLNEEVEKLRKAVLATQSSKSDDVFDFQIKQYPKYRNYSNAKILHIKEVGYCPYLLSFLLAYITYLFDNKDIKSKLILVDRNIFLNGAKYLYKDGTRINNNTFKNKTLITNRFLLIDQPKQEILNSILATGEDLYIVYDRMYGEDIIEGNNVQKLYSSSGISLAKRAGLKLEKCIFSGKAYSNNFISIPRIEKYPEDESTRNSYYFDSCEQLYLKLNDYLSI